jgi:DNA repair photolyase
MDVKEIEAKVLLSHVKQPDSWFGLKYNMNLYRGCQHRCIYCDSRSDCYQIDNFDSEILVKANAIDLLARELASKRVKGTIGTGSMNDPYMPLERTVNLTGRSLEVIARFRFPVHVLTKSDLVLKDLETLCEINKVFAAVSFTITTADDVLGKKLEPGAPLVSARLEAMRVLAEHNVHTGILLMPVLPFIEDSKENISEIVRLAHEHGATYVIPAFGMTLRGRQRTYYYRKLDLLFPGLRQRYEREFGSDYHCPATGTRQLNRLFEDLCERYGLATRVERYTPQQGKQLRLL